MCDKMIYVKNWALRVIFLPKSYIKRSEIMVNPILMAAGDPPVFQVVLMGVGVVFTGLVCIIGLCYLVNYVLNMLLKDNKGEAKAEDAPIAPVAPVSGGAIENRQEILAAVCAAVAEENGTDISAIRVISFKKV